VSVGTDMAGVGVDGRCWWALTWQVLMGTGGRRWSLGGGDDVVPLGGFVRGVGGRRRDQRAHPGLAQAWALTRGLTVVMTARGGGWWW
jgi:hypothetical protein